MKGIKYITLIVGAFLILSASKCKEKNPSKSKCEFVGEIVDFTGMDGCGLVLQTKEETFEVVSWPNGYTPKEGDKIAFSFANFDGASICMVGPIIEVTCLDKLD